ncbi:MAG: hypothetical protein GON13_01740 [Nanoarchaeota archaeon]|nr:hypothetical protein [Nanoarchaeota archaeon]
MSKRLVYIDWIRAVAIVLMVFWQVFDFFSEYNVYSDSPFFFSSINAPIHLFVLVLFSGMAGAGLYLYLSKVKKKQGFKKTFFRVLKKYSWLIVISFFFTFLVWDFCTFYTWSEAIQGVGLVGIFAFIILYLEFPTIFVVSLSLAVGIFQQLIKPLLMSAVSTLPFCVTNLSFEMFFSLPVNFLFRGFFSVINLLPLMLWGASMVKYLNEKSWRTIFFLGCALIFFGVILHNVIPINFYERSPTSFLVEIGFLTVLMALGSFLSKTRASSKISLILLPFGMDALIVYLAHFLLVYKPLSMLGLENTFGIPISLIGSFTFLLISNVVINLWRKQYS